MAHSARMTNISHDQPADGPDHDRLLPWERWSTDSVGQPIIEWDAEAHAEWCEKWAPRCPAGNSQRLRRALGFWERNLCELELRLPLARGEGACEVIVDERDEEVHVRVLVCYRDDADDEEDFPSPRDYTDCPVRTWLERPLGQRAVIDVDGDEELPLYTPYYLNNVRQPDHGYRSANRRRARPRP